MSMAHYAKLTVSSLFYSWRKPWVKERKVKCIADSLFYTIRHHYGMRTVKFISSTLVEESLRSRPKIFKLNIEENRYKFTHLWSFSPYLILRLGVWHVVRLKQKIINPALMHFPQVVPKSSKSHNWISFLCRKSYWWWRD